MDIAGNSRKKLKISTVVIYTILILWAITTIFPFVWVIMNSFKPSSEVLNSSFSLPADPSFANYANAFKKLNIAHAYRNSIIISTSVTVVTMVISTMMAFALTRYSFKGKTAISALINASLMIPVFATIIGVMAIMVKAGFIKTGNLLAVILPQIAGNFSFATIVMTGFLRGLPLEMEEAAYMEGANVGQVFTRIIVPLSKSSLATVAIFTFLWSYNDLFTQSFLIKNKKELPICGLLKQITSLAGTDYGMMAASITMIIVPVMIVYMFLQKNIVKGLTAGAVKG